MRAILTYHSIDDSGSPVSISPAAFRRHVEWLASGTVRVVSLEALLAAPDDQHRVAITFDDGFASVATEAAPLLAAHGFPATVFVVTDHVGATNDWGGQAWPGVPSLALLDWEGLGRLTTGGFTIGSHSRTHARLDAIGAPMLRDELDTSAERIERELGVRPEWFAYPYGALNGVVATAVAERYRGGLTTEYRLVQDRDDRARLPRLDAYYFRAGAGLAGWSKVGFRSRLWARRQARRVRAAWRAWA